MPTNDFAVKSCYYESVLHGKYEDEEEEVWEVSGRGRKYQKRKVVLIVVIPVLI